MSDSIAAQLSEVYSHCSTPDILTDVVHVLNLKYPRVGVLSGSPLFYEYRRPCYPR